MATLIIDCVTIGKKWDSFDEYTQSTMTERTTENEVKNLLGLSPLTGSLFAISLYDRERRKAVVYVTSGTGSEGVKVCSEKEMLEDFWDGAQSYDVFVTFGGARFDIPFILLRSAVLGIAPTVEFSPSRSLLRQSIPYHVDLKDQLSFFGAVRPCTLHQVCTSFGITSPDSSMVNGKMVNSLYQESQFDELNAYAEDNAQAIAQLYEQWFSHLAPNSFRNLLL